MLNSMRGVWLRQKAIKTFHAMGRGYVAQQQSFTQVLFTK